MARRSNKGYQTGDDLYYLNDPNMMTSDVSSTWNNYGGSSSGFLSQIPIVGKLLDTGVGSWLNALIGNSQDDLSERQRQLSTDKQRLAIQLGRENNANELANTYMANMLEKERADAYNQNQLALQQNMNDFNLRMWDLNNKYNTPAAQLQRAKDAGINPNIVFGQPVASSPVQQTSLPDQSRAGVAKANFKSPDLPSLRSIQDRSSAILSGMADMFKMFFSSLPQSVLASAQARKTNADAEAQEMENDATKNAKHMYTNAQFVVNPSDSTDLISFAEYNELPESDQQKYQIKVDGSKAGVPNLFKPGFNSEKGFTAFKDVLRLKNILKDIKADDLEQSVRISQARIKEEIANMQLSDPEKKAINAIADLPWQEYRNVLGAANKSIREGSEKWLDQQFSKDKTDIAYKQRLIKKLDDDDQWRKDHDVKALLSKLYREGISWETALDAIVTLVLAKAGLN